MRQRKLDVMYKKIILYAVTFAAITLACNTSDVFNMFESMMMALAFVIGFIIVSKE